MQRKGDGMTLQDSGAEYDLARLEEENKKLVEEYGKLSEMWQIEHAEKLTLVEKLKFAEERIKYLRATIMNEIEDEPTVDTESMMFHDQNGGGV